MRCVLLIKYYVKALTSSVNDSFIQENVKEDEYPVHFKRFLILPAKQLQINVPLIYSCEIVISSLK